MLYSLHLLELFPETYIGFGENSAHLVPILAHLLVVYLVFDGELLEVFIKLLDLLFEVISRVVQQSTQIERVVYLLLFNLNRLFGQHNLECLGALMDGRFRNEWNIFLGHIPFVWIMQQKYLLLADIQLTLHP